MSRVSIFAGKHEHWDGGDDDDDDGNNDNDVGEECVCCKMMFRHFMLMLHAGYIGVQDSRADE